MKICIARMMLEVYGSAYLLAQTCADLNRLAQTCKELSQ